MEGYKRGSHTVWDSKYHVVWVAAAEKRFSERRGQKAERRT
jgi:hypothetical protein